MPVTKEQFLARMAAGRAKKAAERTAAAAPAPAAPKPKTKAVTAGPVTTIKPKTKAVASDRYISHDELKAIKASMTPKSSEAPLA